jgi:hypothetical protein
LAKAIFTTTGKVVRRAPLAGETIVMLAATAGLPPVPPPAQANETSTREKTTILLVLKRSLNVPKAAIDSALLRN